MQFKSTVHQKARLAYSILYQMINTVGSSSDNIDSATASSGIRTFLLNSTYFHILLFVIIQKSIR